MHITANQIILTNNFWSHFRYTNNIIIILCMGHYSSCWKDASYISHWYSYTIGVSPDIQLVVTCYHDTSPTVEYLVIFKALLTQYSYFGQILLKIGYFHKYLSKNLICHINIYVTPLPIGYHTDTPLPVEYHHDTILHSLWRIIIWIPLQLDIL